MGLQDIHNEWRIFSYIDLSGAGGAMDELYKSRLERHEYLVTMADITSIQWADSTVNPIMGCGGCELFPKPAQIFLKINEEVRATGHKISSRAIYEELVARAHGAIDHPLQGHKNAVNTTNIWHLRQRFLMRVLDETDADFAARDAAEKTIKESITCYAAIIHLNKGQSLEKENYKGHPGYAPIFEAVTQFPGRAEKTAKLKDLLGCTEGRSPWKGNLPRLIFVSDMGDALSSRGQFPFLKSDLLPAINSDAGKRHLWLWLTKRPAQLAEFSEQIGGLPENVCVMTTLTGSNQENFRRLAALKKVKANICGLSIEPLWERIDPKKLDLKGIDWVIVGGESGSGKLTRPFALEWAEELRDYCRKKRVAFFLKQLGRNPTRGGKLLPLKDRHGGDWDEWPEETFKIREFPKAFHQYRKKEMKRSNKPHPPAKRKLEIAITPPTSEEKVEFKRLNKIVSKGVKGFVEAGEALIKIHDGKLWRAGNYKTWDDYCRSVAGMSRIHAHRLMKASQCVIELQANSDFTVLPVTESQVRPLLKLKNTEDRQVAWQQTINHHAEYTEHLQPTEADVRAMVEAIINQHEEDEGKIKNQRPTLKQQRAKIVTKLRIVISKRKSWDEVDKLLSELEKMII